MCSFPEGPFTCRAVDLSDAWFRAGGDVSRNRHDWEETTVPNVFNLKICLSRRYRVEDSRRVFSSVDASASRLNPILGRGFCRIWTYNDAAAEFSEACILTVVVLPKGTCRDRTLDPKSGSVSMRRRL